MSNPNNAVLTFSIDKTVARERFRRIWNGTKQIATTSVKEAPRATQGVINITGGTGANILYGIGRNVVAMGKAAVDGVKAGVNAEVKPVRLVLEEAPAVTPAKPKITDYNKRQMKRLQEFSDLLEGTKKDALASGNLDAIRALSHSLNILQEGVDDLKNGRAVSADALMEDAHDVIRPYMVSDTVPEEPEVYADDQGVIPE